MTRHMTTISALCTVLYYVNILLKYHNGVLFHLVDIAAEDDC